jgi:hypothetical protein
MMNVPIDTVKDMFILLCPLYSKEKVESLTSDEDVFTAMVATLNANPAWWEFLKKTAPADLFTGPTYKDILSAFYERTKVQLDCGNVSLLRTMQFIAQAPGGLEDYTVRCLEVLKTMKD